MGKANLMISRNNDVYNVVVEGRATFECSLPLKNCVESLESGAIKKMTIDLKSCAWMDSTFMGTLATVALHGRKAGVTMEILNSDVTNRKLLNEIGVAQLFVFKDSDGDDLPQCTHCNELFESKDHKKEISKAVLEAHETLMSVDDKNIPKFKNVVKLVRKEIEDDNK